MNLPDNLGGKKKTQISGLGPSLNDQIFRDMQMKKNIMNNIHQKSSFSTPNEISQKPASELHGEKLMVPQQLNVDDDEINELLNGANFVQANWNIGGNVRTSN